MRSLYEQLKEWSDAYYLTGRQLVPDAVYDAALLKYNNARIIDPSLPEPPAGTSGATTMQKRKHGMPMISLGNTFSVSETTDHFSADDYPLVGELKIDGLSFSTAYEDGERKYTLTRYNYIDGEDVSIAANTIKSLPAQLQGDYPKFIEIRGEVVLYNDDFVAMNSKRSKLGLDQFENPRNAVAGAIRLQTAKEAQTRPMRVLAYTIGATSGYTYTTQWQLLHDLRTWGLPVDIEHSTLINSPQELADYITKYSDLRPSIPFPIDGLVFKVNGGERQIALGSTHRKPKWAVAYKFPPDVVSTKLMGVVNQVGRTGIVTPVAVLDPISVGGVTVSRATLHNYDEVTRLGIQIGHSVLVQRAGDVIPQILGPDPVGDHNKTLTTIRAPIVCPSCGKRLQSVPGEVQLRCTNGRCGAQIHRKLEHYTSRDAMNIVGFGPATILSFIRDGRLRTISDLYTLPDKEDKYGRIQDKPKWSEHSYLNMLKAIEVSKTTTVPRFIYALGIPGVGLSSAYDIANTFGTAEAFIAAARSGDIGKFTCISDIGVVTANNIIGYFSHPDTNAEVDAIIKYLTFVIPEEDIEPKPLVGKSFAFTGTLSIPRGVLQSKVVTAGGAVTNTVSKTTSYLVAGENPGDKLDKARRIGVKIISEAELMELIERG